MNIKENIVTIERDKNREKNKILNSTESKKYNISKKRKNEIKRRDKERKEM